MSDAAFAFVGCFTTPKRGARGLGIDGYRVGTPGPEGWVPVARASNLVNPSYLLADQARRVLYAVHGDEDYASAFAVDADGQLTPLGTAAAGGSNVVHLALDPTGRMLIVANYATGTVTALPVGTDGALAPFSDRVALPGPSGPHRGEQTCSHPHQIVFDPSGRFVLVPDKGLDRVFVLAFDAGRLALAGDVAMRPGAGPRHLAFHPRAALVVLLNELDSTVATLRWDAAAGTLTPLHLVSTLPADFFGASAAAAIVITPDGRHVFASNRGQDGIVRLAVDAADGRLRVLGWTPSGGRGPRFMTLNPTGTHLLVANENGDTINAFAVGSDGDLAPAGARESRSPCSIAFL